MWHLLVIMICTRYNFSALIKKQTLQVLEILHDGSTAHDLDNNDEDTVSSPKVPGILEDKWCPCMKKALVDFFFIK